MAHAIELARAMGPMLNKEHAQSSMPNEKSHHLHRPELLLAAARGDPDEIERLLHREDEDAARQPGKHFIDFITGIKDTIVADIIGAGDTVLHVAASSGDGEEFLKCASVIVGEASHLLGARNLKGDTPLHCAARLRNTSMVYRLLELARASWDGTSDDARVKAILRMQNNKEETVLHEAVRSEDKEMIGELLSVDSQLARVPLTDGASPLYLALSLGHRDIAQLLFEKDKELSYSGPDGQNAFHAAILGRLGEEAIKMLLESNKYLIKQADRSTRRTPLHYAALFGETKVTELLLSADPSPAYLPDGNGSSPIHLAASNGQPDNVLALLQKSGPYCAKLRDGNGRTFLHVAAEAERFGVVTLACQEQGKMFASSVMNMQDDDGNTALHLAALAGSISIVRALVSIREVKLNLTNKRGEIPRDVAFIGEHSPGTSRGTTTPAIYTWNSRYRIHLVLRDACGWTDWRPWIGLSWTEFKSALDEEDRSQNIAGQTQIIALGSVLITTVTFAAAFAVPGGYRADDHNKGGTATLAGQYFFDAFVIANTLAFICSALSMLFLMYAGVGSNVKRRTWSLLFSVKFLAHSARSLSAAFIFGMYSILAPVEHAKAMYPCTLTLLPLVLVEGFWSTMTVGMVYSDKVVMVRRFGSRARLWSLAWAVLVTLIFQFWPYILIAAISH